jgi:hypothetical protein
MAHNRRLRFDDLSKSWMVLPSGEEVRNKPNLGEELPSSDAVTGPPSDHGNEEPRTDNIMDMIMWLVSSLRVALMRLANAVYLTPILAYMMPKTFGLPPLTPPLNEDSKRD